MGTLASHTKKTKGIEFILFLLFLYTAELGNVFRRHRNIGYDRDRLVIKIREFILAAVARIIRFRQTISSGIIRVGVRIGFLRIRFEHRDNSKQPKSGELRTVRVMVV